MAWLQSSLRLGALAEIERWVPTWGADAEVVQPKELRHRLRATAATLLERYR